MNTKLPFALSALGLMSLAIHQPALAQSEGPSVTLELQVGAAQPPVGVATVNGQPLKVKDRFLVAPTGPFSGLVEFTARSSDGSLTTMGFNVQSDNAEKFQAGLTQGYANTVEALRAKDPGIQILGFLEARNEITGVGVPVPLTRGLPGAAGGVAAAANNGANLVVAQGFADPSQIVADIQSVQVGAVTEGLSNASLAVPGNTVAAASTVNSQVAAQTLASGEDNLAVAVLGTTVDQTTSTAAVENSTVGVRVNGPALLTGADTGLTVNDNALTATARANDGNGALNASGAEAGVIGNSAGVGDADHTYPASGSLALTGDLLATGVQQLDQQSDVNARIGTSVIGVTGGASAVTVNAIGGGIAVNGNEASARADGNRLALSLAEDLSGADVDSTLYGLQTVNDTDVGAIASNLTVGQNLTDFNSSSLAVDDNRVQAVATANRATAALAARPDGSNDSVYADVEQFVRSQSQAVTINADVAGSLIGRSGSSANAATSHIADNRLAAVAIGNEQATTADLGAGVQAGSVRLEGNQTLLVGNQDLSIDADLDNSLIGTRAGQEFDSRTTINGNSAIGQVVGNNASQASGAFAGVREATLSANLSQRATASVDNSLRLSSDINNLHIGADAALRGPSLTVDQNQVASLATLNRATQALGTQSGSNSTAGTVAVVATQVADGVETDATVTDLRIGIPGSGPILASGVRLAADLTITGNQVDAQAELNRAQQTLDGISGSVAGPVTFDTTQTANGAGGGLSGVDAILDGTGIGIYGSSGPIAIDNGRFDLVVSGNRLGSQAQANLAQASLGAISGTVNLASVTDRLSAGTNQTAADTTVRAQNFDTGLGIAEAAPATTLFDAATNTVSITVVDNALQALARQNNAGIATGAVSGDVRSGDLRSQVQQRVSGTGITRAENSGVFVGVTPAVGANDLNLGAAAQRTALTITGNSVRADAADNLATVSGGGGSGSVGANARVGALIEQNSSGSLIEALNTQVNLGAAEQNDRDLGDTAGSETYTVADNTVATVAAGNVGNASLGGVSGNIDAGGNTGVTTMQTLVSQVTATTTDVRAGITDASLGNAGASGEAALTVAGNGVITAASGNDSRVNLGSSAARIDGTLGAATTQSVDAGASLAASASGLRIGATDIGTLGSAGAVAVSVDGNAVRTSATANTSSVNAALSGALSGVVAIEAAQTLNGSAAGISAVTGSLVNPNRIGVQADSIGPNATVSVDGNLVNSAVAGNRVLNNLDGAAFSSATGSLTLAATQTVNGVNAVNGDLRAEVTATNVGVISAGGTLLPSAAITGNQLVADTVGNQSNRVLDDLSGNFNPATVAVTMNDGQTVSGAILIASVNTSFIGGDLLSNASVPTKLAVNGNAVLAQSIANSASQTVSLNGVNAAGGQLTSLNAGQSLINSTVRAEVANVSIGLSTASATGPGTFTGTAVTSGNSINATAIGNQSSLIRNGR